jgi:hypothetical protein
MVDQAADQMADDLSAGAAVCCLERYGGITADGWQQRHTLDLGWRIKALE